MESRAAFAAEQPLEIVEVDVGTPNEGEVLVDADVMRAAVECRRTAWAESAGKSVRTVIDF